MMVTFNYICNNALKKRVNNKYQPRANEQNSRREKFQSPPITPRRRTIDWRSAPTAHVKRADLRLPVNGFRYGFRK